MQEVIYYPNGTTSTVTHSDPATKPIVLSRNDFKKHIITAFGGDNNAKEKLQTYIDGAAAESGTTGAAKRRRGALEDWRNQEEWSKQEATDWMDNMQFSTAAPDDKGVVRTAWPEA